MEIPPDLNAEQKIAVDTIEGPLLVLAGAGSGKTRVVTFRIANLLAKGVPPSKILGLTFTNKAAAEMQQRVKALTESDVLVCTFHSLGVRILRESIQALGYTRSFTIYDEEDVDKLLKLCLSEHAIEGVKSDTKALRGMISKAKNALLNADAPELVGSETVLQKIFPAVYASYQSKMHEYNALDFDDLLFLTVRLFREHPHILAYYQSRWSFLLIDEYQDTNAAQYEMVMHLIAKTHNLCVVGDPDQSIYSWRGANIKNILNFESDYPGAKVVRLDRNYRSHTNILSGANALIGRNTNRYEKQLWSDLGAGEKIKRFCAEDERVEAQFIVERIVHHHETDRIPLSQAVVFYRTNAQSRAFEDFLLRRRIPYVIVGGISFYHRREVKDILAFLRMVHSGCDFISFMRTINLPKRGIGEVTIERIQQAATREKRSILSCCEALLSDPVSQASCKLSAKQKEGVQSYINIIQALKKIAEEGSLKDLVKAAIDLSGYIEYIKEDKETFQDRKSNLNSLVSKALEWEVLSEDTSLSTFLEELSLKSSLDDANTDNEHVSLMTIHNGKGLEFSLTFLAGLEEDLFPHANSRGNADALEEERRLCYVGMTRAKKYLYLTHAEVRYTWGVSQKQRPSRFLSEVPLEYIEKFTSSTRPRQAYPFSSRRQGVTQELAQNAPNEPKESRESNVIPIANIANMANEAASASSNVVDKSPFVAGEAIFHKEFGVGFIREVYEGSVGLTYKIFFSKDNCEKSIVAKYANLNRL